MQELIANFSSKLPENKTERKQVLLNTATTICERDRKFDNTAPEVNVSQIEDGGKEAQVAARRLSFASQIVNEQFTDDVPVSDFDSIRGGVDKATKYAPLLGSYQRLADSSCAASKNRTDESIRRFEVSAIMFGVDVMLTTTGGFYKPAFAGTRYTMNTASKLGFYRMRYVCGNRCWALVWSEVHYGIRGQMTVTLHELAQYATSSDLNLTRKDLRAVAELQGVDQEAVIERSGTLLDDGKRIERNVSSKATNVTENVSKNVTDCLTDVSENREEALNDTKEEVDDAVSGLFGNESESSNDTQVCEKEAETG